MVTQNTASTALCISLFKSLDYQIPADVLWEDDTRKWPPVTSTHIEQYLLDSIEIDQLPREATKSLAAYNFVESGWVILALVYTVQHINQVIAENKIFKFLKPYLIISYLGGSCLLIFVKHRANCLRTLAHHHSLSTKRSIKFGRVFLKMTQFQMLNANVWQEKENRAVTLELCFEK